MQAQQFDYCEARGWGGGALCAGPRVEAEKSGSRGAGSRRLNNDVAEGSGAQSAGSRHKQSGAGSTGCRGLPAGAALEAQAPVAGRVVLACRLPCLG